MSDEEQDDQGDRGGEEEPETRRIRVIVRHATVHGVGYEEEDDVPKRAAELAVERGTAVYAADYAELTVAELKDELERRELKVSGTKPELIARLEEDDADQDDEDQTEEG